MIDTRTGTRSNGKVKERLPPCAIRDKRFCCKHLRSREGVVYYALTLPCAQSSSRNPLSLGEGGPMLSFASPTKECLDSVFAALRDAGLLNRTGKALLPQLNELAEGKWPVRCPEVCHGMAAHPPSMALAFSLVLLQLPGKWDAESAWIDYNEIKEALETAWKVVSQDSGRRLRRTVDHAIVYGIRRSWDPALDFLTTTLAGDIRRYRGPVGECVGYLRGRPVGNAPGAANTAMDGLIPDLDLVWGEDFRNDANFHVAAILNKLLQPWTPLSFQPGEGVRFEWCGEERDQLVARSYSKKILLPGSKRNFKLKEGDAALHRDGKEFAKVDEGQRLILRVNDDGRAELQLADSQRGNVVGPILRFNASQEVKLEFSTKGSLEAWNCTCGSWACDLKHRMEGWDPKLLPENETLASFLWTAVKGSSRQLHIKSFVGGMYYAALCNGE